MNTSANSQATVDGAALRLLQFEAEIRRIRQEDVLLTHLANEVRSLVPHELAIVWRRARTGPRWRAVVVSGLQGVDPHTPLLDALARLLGAQQSHSHVISLDMHAPATLAPLNDVQRQLLLELPFASAYWIPLPDHADRVDAGVLFMKEQAFSAGAPMLLDRLGDTYSHAWRALSGKKRRALPDARRRWLVAAATGAAILIGAIPMRLSVMAPVEVVAARPAVVTAPINGVVKRIAVAPGSTVKAGDVLVVFEDIQPRNEMLLAQQRLAVAEARNARITAAAFQEAEAAHELAAARAEYDLARVTYDYTIEVLARTTIRARQDGVAIYTDRRDWEGRAVQVGEEILQVADPTQVALRADLSTGNSLPLKAGDDAHAFLENAPLGGLALRVRYATFTPRALAGGDTAYTVMLDPLPGYAPRIGARGTARLYGPQVPLVVQLLRRPLAALRQHVGI
ncbi:hypothetical protein RCH14_001533 [Massilia sp. MP_M2]|uniref:HlyD family efflux transporter periplasmic adaptor subunit n=1 Tax=Massilia sp. MP_M2 TaxID=3071713 RepID=UPI00319DD822